MGKIAHVELPVGKIYLGKLYIRKIQVLERRIRAKKPGNFAYVSVLGLDVLNPLEIKAGMDPVGITQRHGDRLSLRGGFDARNWSAWDTAEAEIVEKLPVLMEKGGYVFGSDHSIPDTVSFDTMRRIVELVKRIGRY